MAAAPDDLVEFRNGRWHADGSIDVVPRVIISPDARVWGDQLGWQIQHLPSGFCVNLPHPAMFPVPGCIIDAVPSLTAHILGGGGAFVRRWAGEIN